jgi:SAM-dependent methyltransferase
MVETMRANLSGVEIVRAGLLTYEHNGEPADFVYTRNVLHHLPDFWKAIALERVARILRPGGVLRLRDIVYSFEPGEAHEVLDGWVARGARTAAAGWTADELSAHVRDEHSTFGWILEEMLRRTGFDVREVEYDGSKLYAAYVAVKR